MISTRGSLAHRRSRRLANPTASPNAISPPMMATKMSTAEPNENVPSATAATANRYRISAVASLARPLALNDDHGPPRQAEPAGDRQRRDPVGRRDDGARAQTDRPIPTQEGMHQRRDRPR